MAHDIASGLVETNLVQLSRIMLENIMEQETYMHLCNESTKIYISIKYAIVYI